MSTPEDTSPNENPSEQASASPEPVSPDVPEVPLKVSPKMPSVPASQDPTLPLKRLRQAMEAGDDDKQIPAFGTACYDRNPYKPYKPVVGKRILGMPTATNRWISRNVANLELALNGAQKENLDWFVGVDESARFVSTNDSGVKAMSRPGSSFVQTPVFNNQAIAPGHYRRPSKKNTEMNSAEAMYYAMAALDVGIPSTTPLWSSGWWVSFRPATEDEWVGLEDLLTQDKSLGLRSINGLAMSNSSSLVLETVLNFVINHITDTNIRFDGEKAPNYRKLLMAPDIDAFLCGFMSACYPSGYPISRQCTATIKKCYHSVEEIVLLSRLLVVDTDRLRENHLAHMARSGSGQVTEREIEEYVRSLPSNQAFEYPILETENNTIRVKLGVPSADDVINSGNRWNTSLSDLLRNIVSEEADERRRAAVFERHARSSRLREYSHWLSEIHLDSNVVRGVEAIEKVLEIVTANDAARQALYDRIEEFIEHTRVSMIALPNYACPSCGGVQNETLKGENYHPCIPLNVLSVFFHQVQLRVFEIVNRA